MQTQKLTTLRPRLRSTLCLAGGALWIMLPGEAHAQLTRSRPQPSAPAETHEKTEPHSSRPGHSGSSGSTSSGSTPNERATGAVSRGGKVNFKTLFPSPGRGATADAAYRNRLPGLILSGGDLFDGIDVPGLPKIDKSPADKADDVPPTGRTTGSTTSSLDRYKQSQEASAGSDTSKNLPDNSQIPWSSRTLSPFYGYGPDAVIWWPTGIICTVPDSSDGRPEDGVILGWPNYDPQDGLSRDEPPADYRIGEKGKRRRPIDIQPALDDIERAFLEEQPLLLAAHIRREARMDLSTPGKARRSVPSERLLDRLTALFAIRHTINMEFGPPQTRAGDHVAVAAWVVYRDPAATVYRAKVRFVLQAQDGRLILTAFEMD